MEIFVFRTGVFAGPPIDLTGFAVEAEDGHIGKVDEATYREGTGCVVVDTGFWIFGKKRMLPAGMIKTVDPDEKKLYVSMTKDQIKRAPDYNSERHRDDESAYYDETGAYSDPYAVRPARSGERRN
jgi:hypothetical protein